jgi:TPP-dependent pyruvate/acetoin dehydrogenase alpha subunit
MTSIPGCAMENDSIKALRMMMLIRAFETALAKRRDHGFQLLSTGEEGVAVGLCSALGEEDLLLTGGRSIGPALARGVDPGRLAAELLGKAAGTNRGKGGRGHLSDLEAGFFGAHAVVGGNISIAAGVALAKKMEGKGGFVAVLFGDGASGAGALHETLNMAAIWKLPLLFVCNNNQLSVSASRTDMLAPKKLSDFGTSFGLPARTIDGMDVEAVAEAAKAAAQTLRAGHGPVFLECLSQRFAAHSSMARETRSPAELAEIKTNCPILRQVQRLRTAGAIGADAQETLEKQIQAELAGAFAFADAAPYPLPAEVLTDVE